MGFFINFGNLRNEVMATNIAIIAVYVFIIYMVSYNVYNDKYHIESMSKKYFNISKGVADSGTIKGLELICCIPFILIVASIADLCGISGLILGASSLLIVRWSSAIISNFLFLKK